MFLDWLLKNDEPNIALTLMIRRQEGHPPSKNLLQLKPNVFPFVCVTYIYFS